MKHVVIIGNGISGTTAARHIRKRGNHRITIISSETEHFFSRTALMYVYMGHMKYTHIKPYEDWFWGKNKIDLVFDHVEEIETQAKLLRLAKSSPISYDVLIVATGSKSNKFGWPGQDLQGVQGLYSYPDLEQMEVSTNGIKSAVIVGGGLIGVEMAEMLRSRKIDVTFLVREQEFWSNVLPLQEASLISHHVMEHGVDLQLSTELKEILGKNGKVDSVVTSKGEVVPCEFVGLTVGVSPNIEMVKRSGIACGRGVFVDEYLRTNTEDVYAIGDCVERKYDLPGRKNIEQVWYTGRMMGEVVAQTVCGEPTKYEPGPWFNSAKFFDIEYQTYGTVGNELRGDESDFYWEHPMRNKCVHFVWNKTSRQFLGVNVFGIRYRHERFDRWLRENRTIDYVMEHLPEANFDPEFFDRHEKEVQAAFRNQQSKAA